MRHTRAIIDLSAIKHNIAIIKQQLKPGTDVIAVVKANGYGHGAIEVARAALSAGVTRLAVAIPDEGVELRAAGITAPIIVLGLIADEEALLCAENHLTVTVCAPEHLPSLSRAAQRTGCPVSIVLKTDTGMGRIGAKKREALELAQVIKNSPGLDLASLFTHFASADKKDLTQAKQQLADFNLLLKNLEDLGLRPPLVSASASAAVFSLPDSQFDSVRLGIAMYGLYPSDEIRRYVELKPALSLTSRISYVKKLPAGSPVGYGATYHTKRDEYIATLPLGYGDGYSRRLSNQARVLINGRSYPVIGNVCMDQFMVSLGSDEAAQAGDLAVLVGQDGGECISLEELAALAGTINYELTCNISARVPRMYIE